MSAILIILFFFVHALHAQEYAIAYPKQAYQTHFVAPAKKQQNILDTLAVHLQTHQISNGLSANDRAFYCNKDLQTYMWRLVQNLFLLNNGTKIERIKAFCSIAYGNHPPPCKAMVEALQKVLQAHCADDGKLMHLDRDDYMSACLYQALKETLPHKVYLEVLNLLKDKTSTEIFKAEKSYTIWGYILHVFWEKFNRLLHDYTKRASCTIEHIKQHSFNLQLKNLLWHIENCRYETAQQIAQDNTFLNEIFKECCPQFIQRKEHESIEALATQNIPLLFDEDKLIIDLQSLDLPNRDFNTDNNRIDAIHNTLSKPEYTNHTFALSDQSEKLLHTFGINASCYKTFYGNQIQKALHVEHLQIINSSAGIYFIPGQKQSIKSIIEHTLNFVDAARAYNHAGYLKKSTRVTDCCWSLLNGAFSIAKGATKGIYKGTKNYVDYAVDHPLQAVARPVIGNLILAYHLAQLTLDVADVARIGVGTLAGQKNSIEEWQQLCTNITTVKNALQEKYASMNLEDCVTEITALATEAMLDYKCSKALFKLYQSGERKTLELIGNLKNNLPPPPLQAVALTPEGFEVGIACQAAAIATGNKDSILAKLEKFGGGNSLFASSVRPIQGKNCTQQIDQKIPDFIKFDRVPQDKETILSDPSFIRTKKIYDGARIYKKNNLYYYRDQLHTGKRAHLEVFDKRGKHLGEADPITGALIPGTLDKNKTIKI